jgi:hypothetical protein
MSWYRIGRNGAVMCVAPDPERDPARREGWVKQPSGLERHLHRIERAGDAAHTELAILVVAKQ